MGTINSARNSQVQVWKWQWRTVTEMRLKMIFVIEIVKKIWAAVTEFSQEIKYIHQC